MEEKMAEMFINDGWSKTTSFSIVSEREAEEIGCLSMIERMKKGEVFYRMAVSGNIYDEKGNLVLLDLKAKAHDECPFGGDAANDCDGCAYSGAYHFSNGDCVRR